MPLLEQFQREGQWLFRWRSYLPLLFLAVILAGLPNFHYPFGSHRWDQVWDGICLGVAALGVAVRVMTIGTSLNGTSGRNTKSQIAESLNTTGIYSVVRNPLYLGNFLMVLGVVLMLRVWWVELIYVMLFALYYERIIFAEESFLQEKFGPTYHAWAERTPAIFPRLSLWTPPANHFSWKRVIRREYHGVCGVVGAMFLVEFLGDLAIGEGAKLDGSWAVILGVTALGYIVIRILHKWTRLLHGD